MGGGAMRTAVKAAVLGGYRSATSRAAARSPASAVVAPSGGSGPAISVLASDKGLTSDAPAALERPSWEMDDWEFTGGEEEALLDSLHPAPRLVFGPVPTLEEAKEAASDLKDAVEKAYFSPTTTKGCHNGNEAYSLSESAAILPSVPKHVAQAFSLLQGCPEAQNVVASLASDKNVWDAVMKNENVINFYKTHQNTILPSETSIVSTNFAAKEVNSESMEDPEILVEKTPSSSVFMDVVNAAKQKVSEMVSNICDFFEDLFRPSVEARNTVDTKPSTESYVDITIGATFIALGIAAILVILLKRG